MINADFLNLRGFFMKKILVTLLLFTAIKAETDESFELQDSVKDVYLNIYAQDIIEEKITNLESCLINNKDQKAKANCLTAIWTLYRVLENKTRVVPEQDQELLKELIYTDSSGKHKLHPVFHNTKAK